MKSKIESLSKNEDFKNLLSGRKISNQYSTIFFKKLSGKRKTKFNISFVTKKKLGNAVIRNRIKRRLRSIARELSEKSIVNQNYCYLLIAKKSVIEDKYDKIKEKFFSDLKGLK